MGRILPWTRPRRTHGVVLDSAVVFSETLGAPGAPDLVLLHGGIGTGRYHWSKLADLLAADHRVHLPDLPGHGRTPLEGDRYDREVLVEAVEGLLDGLGPPVHVAGFSMGGHTALALAARRPELFASLALIGVSHREHAGLEGWRARFDPETLEATYPLWVRALARIHEPLGGPEAWRDVCRRDAGGLAVDVDLDDLGAVTCPVLLVRGDRDEAVDPAQYAELRAVWEQADEFVVPAGGHDVQLTRAAVTGPVLAEYLTRVRGGRAR